MSGFLKNLIPDLLDHWKLKLLSLLFAVLLWVYLRQQF